VRVGAAYPQTELRGDPLAVARIGRAVEELGYDHLLMYDHVVGAVHENRDPPLAKGPYTDEHPFHDPLVAFAYLAGITQRIEFVTGILILPQRPTVLVAKQAADLDLLSGGRLRLGVGVGWNYVEYDVLGQSYATRGERLTEQIPFLRRLWTEPLVTFKGRFDSIDRANINPRPRRRIPIYCGGFSEPAFRRAAQLADGFIFAGGLKASLAGWERVRALLALEGRSTADFGVECLLQDGKARGLDPDDAIETFRGWRAAGGTHACVVTMGRSFRSIDEHIAYLAEISERLAKVRAEG